MSYINGSPLLISSHVSTDHIRFNSSCGTAPARGAKHFASAPGPAIGTTASESQRLTEAGIGAARASSALNSAPLKILAKQEAAGFITNFVQKQIALRSQRGFAGDKLSGPHVSVHLDWP